MFSASLTVTFSPAFGATFKIFKAGVHRIACTAQIVEQAVTGIIRQNPVKFNLRHSTWIVQYLYDFHHGFGFVFFAKCVQAKVPRFKAGRAITFAVVNGLHRSNPSLLTQRLNGHSPPSSSHTHRSSGHCGLSGGSLRRHRRWTARSLPGSMSDMVVTPSIPTILIIHARQIL